MPFKIKSLLFIAIFAILSCQVSSKDIVSDNNSFSLSNISYTPIKREYIDDFEEYMDSMCFSNSSLLYWRKENDYFQLILELNNGKQFILNTRGREILNGIGTQFVKEYDEFLLFEYRWISGCCTHPDIILLDKESGMELFRVKSSQLIYANSELDFLLFFTDDSLAEVVFYDLNVNQDYHFQLETKGLQSVVDNLDMINSTDYDLLFDFPKFNDNKISIVYKSDVNKKNDCYYYDSIVFQSLN